MFNRGIVLSSGLWFRHRRCGVLDRLLLRAFRTGSASWRQRPLILNGGLGNKFDSRFVGAFRRDFPS